MQGEPGRKAMTAHLVNLTGGCPGTSAERAQRGGQDFCARVFRERSVVQLECGKGSLLGRGDRGARLYHVRRRRFGPDERGYDLLPLLVKLVALRPLVKDRRIVLEYRETRAWARDAIDQPAENFLRLGAGPRTRVAEVLHGLEWLAQQGIEDLFLGLEVVVERGLAGAELLRDLGDGRAAIPLGCDEVASDVEDPGPRAGGLFLLEHEHILLDDRSVSPVVCGLAT